MRFTVFYAMLVVAVLLSAWNVLWPWWDRHEADFVTSLLVHMKPAVVDSSANVWLGPPVETDATALVAGSLRVLYPPRASADKDWFGGKTYRDCANAYQQLQVPAQQFLGNSDWRDYGTRHDLEGMGVYIGSWAIDPRLLQGALVKLEEISITESATNPEVKCPDGYDSCRVVESCIPLKDYSALGNRNKDKNGAWLVQLPDPSLMDYPLFQEGMQPPDAFAANYASRMAGRAAIFPLWQCIVMFVLSLGMLIVARDENIFALAFRAPQQAAVRVVQLVLNTHQDVWDFIATLLTFSLPFLPLLAYQHIAERGLFDNIIYGYIGGLALMLYGFVHRLHGVAAPEEPVL
ncbi:MAG: hypothetical protein PW788_09200 [Micavibrio sp.]|nr:hypothetical protein [Micavibrio sp.]